MNKNEFVKAFEVVLRNANVDVISLDLIDDEHVEITYVGGGKRKVNIACDSYKSIMIDVLKYCEQKVRCNAMFKLRIYKLSGADKGNLDHEEFSRKEKKWNQ